MSVSFGLLLPTREAAMKDERPDFQPILELAEQAESSGFHSVWVGDSLIARPRLEAVTTLAAVAARTRQIRVGTAVLLSALRHPLLLANELATLDLISDGRLILGLGIAERNTLNEHEFDSLGLPFGRRVSLFEEGVEVMRRLWAEPEVTIEGRYFKLDKVSLGVRPRQEKVPVWLAGRTEATFHRVVTSGDGWFPLLPSPEAFGAAWSRLQEVAVETGRDLTSMDRAVYVTLRVDNNADRAEREVMAFFEDYYEAPYEGLSKIHAACAGPAERCAAWLSDFAAAGAQTMVVRFIGDDQVKQVRSFTEDIVPLVRERSGG